MSDPVAELTSAVTDGAAELAAGGRVAEPRLDRPPRPDFGDYSTNAAMLLAPTLGEPPRAIAERLRDELGRRLGSAVERVEVAGPGFLNLFMAEAWYLDALAAMLEAGDAARPRGGGRAGARGVRVRQPHRAAHRGLGAPRRLRRLAGPDTRAGRQPRGARVLRERRRQPGAQVRRGDPGARPRRGARGVPRRLRDRAGRADRRRRRGGPGRAGPAGHRADGRGGRAHARPLPRADGPLLLRALARRPGRRGARRPGRRLRARRRASGCAPPSAATTRTACCAARAAS